ncbi:hypothetical protein M2139_001660 [Enterococcus sp. PF1-24]|uniref:hypothetical protein n=1 Tax=unclassified Enterococcus TaxID=2608891 RepID=UPI00247533C8|nr:MULTISPECIES: hypothetical protein [unclassified Enterococcus]MDH6364673.1 hypothetical protein [Enterococcus sp. PFB1-1]MDH6401774.1 hypothetical protein [Enterococcus sp. PF1-24]
MKFSFELETDKTVEEIWAFYEDVNKWFAWEDDLEDISLNGAFQTGTTGEMKLAGQPAMAFTLVSVIKNKEFIDKTEIPEVGTLYFSHVLEEIDNKTVIRHSVSFVPLDRAATVEDLGFVSQVFADVPKSIFSLVKVTNE